jgi:hypothetical protein
MGRKAKSPLIGGLGCCASSEDKHPSEWMLSRSEPETPQGLQ